MTKPRNAIEAYDRLADTLENMLLDAPPGEFKVQSVSDSRVSDVKAIVDKQLARARVKTPRRAPASMSRLERSEQIALVSSLIASRANVPARVRAVFGKGETATAEEIDELLDDLRKQGILPPTTP